jgi:NAD(P)-dependent dehydrogenase (short-subunit alcohol dehydrogenase family)
MTQATAALEKAALVTGGSRGIGRSAALSIARMGIDVIITYHSNEHAAQTVVSEIQNMGRKAFALRLDTGDIRSFEPFTRSVQEILRSWDQEHLYALVNSAGIGYAAPFAETTEEAFDQLLNVHFKGVYFLTQKLLPILADGGRIVNVTGNLTRVTFAGYSVLGSMKAATDSLSRFLAKELGSRKITVNAISPGAVETDFGGGALRDNPEINAFVASQTALGRVGVPDDVGPMIAALLLDSHRWVNAQTIEVSGGSFF